MKYFVFSLIVISTFSFTISAENKPNADKMKHHIYLLIGQSNMAGRAPFSGKEKDVIPNAFLLNDKNEWQDADNPLNRYSTIRKGMNMQKMNPGYYFAKEMLAKQQGVTLGLIVNAKGGTRIDQWKKSSKFFKDAVSRTKKAMETGTLKGILWHQGESDHKNEKYFEAFSKFVTDLREALGEKDIPFVAGEIKQEVKLINDQLNKLPSALKNTAVVSSKGL
ncbi:MAG: sialate O-acetylesterase, partial [Lentisphaeraceae bacterium]|nr:sialate O-acetylesterase [Lentisphaeraceae bacterium]